MGEDVLIANLRLVGVPGFEGQCCDLHIDTAGRVLAIGPGLDRPEGLQIHDMAGAFASPGWIDLHCHVFEKISEYGVNPDVVGEALGVTTVVDAGSAGEATMQGFKEYVIDKANTRVLAFLNIGSIGLIKSTISEVYDAGFVDVAATIRCAERLSALVCGIKVRASGAFTRHLGIDPLYMAKRCARLLGLPIMVHVGEPPPILEQILPILDAGDIVTHCFNGKPTGTIFDRDGALLPVVQDALARGVLFDVGHGAASFSFDVAQRALECGVAPYSISTDLHVRSLGGVVRDLSTTMSKMLDLGMSLRDVIEAVTTHPARVLGHPELATVQVGALANLTAFEVAEGAREVSDSCGNYRTLRSAIRPLAVVCGRRVIAATPEVG